MRSTGKHLIIDQSGTEGHIKRTNEMHLISPLFQMDRASAVALLFPEKKDVFLKTAQFVFTHQPEPCI